MGQLGTVSKSATQGKIIPARWPEQSLTGMSRLYGPAKQQTPVYARAESDGLIDASRVHEIEQL